MTTVTINFDIPTTNTGHVWFTS